MAEPVMTVDGTFRTPFTAILAGPSGSGKSTFVLDLVNNQERVCDKPFDYLHIYLGTSKSENPLLAGLAEDIHLPHPVEVFDVNDIFPSGCFVENGGGSKANEGGKNLDLSFCLKKFESDALTRIRQQSEAGKRGLVVFDDLMSELNGRSRLMTTLFTKWSSHQSVSVIYITQNLSHSSGSGSSDLATMFKNCRMLVLYKNKMDSKIFGLVAQRMIGDSTELKKMFNKVTNSYRYILIDGDIESPDSLMFRGDIFETEPFEHQKVFTLKSIMKT